VNQRRPERIETICDMLQSRWMDSPQLRLGQLLCVLLDHHAVSMFYVEDEVLMEALHPPDELPLWDARARCWEGKP